MGAGGPGYRPGTGVAARLARGATRIRRGLTRPRPVTVLAVLCVAAVGVAALRDPRPAPVGDPSVGQVVRVGAAQGDSIPGYVSASRRELAELAGAGPPDSGRPADSAGPAAAAGREVYALVTLSGYVAPGQLTAVLRGVAVVEVYARVPMPRVQTQIVRIPAFRLPDDVVAGLAGAAARKDREVQAYRSRAAQLTGEAPEQRRQRAAQLDGAAVAQAEADAYRRGCACVYAAVVRAPVAILDGVAARPQVRTVDPAPEVDRLDRAVFLPPLPEQLDVVRPPADDRLPAGPTGSAPAPREGPRPRSS